jgi:CheY-like chemotaxis protein
MEQSKEQKSPDNLLVGLKILVIDDEIDARELMSIILHYYGAQVSTASSANEALTLLNGNGDRTLPDVIVSDIGMPETDGCQFIEKLRNLDEEHGGEIPAIALSGFCSVTDRLRTISAGFQAHLSKPVEPEKLIALIGQLTGRN